jgi:CubicO group peptidase (beta-lactamase class C family)
MNRRELLAASLGFAIPARCGSPAQIDETLRRGIERRKIPAAVGMAATRDKILYSGAFGKRDAEGAPVAMDSIFGIASMTKAVTSVAAM